MVKYDIHAFRVLIKSCFFLTKNICEKQLTFSGLLQVYRKTDNFGFRWSSLMLKDNSQEIYIKILRAVFTLLGKKPLQFLSVQARSRSGRKVKQKSFLISLVYFWLWLKNIAVASQTAVLGEELDAESMSIPCPKKTCVHIPLGGFYTPLFLENCPCRF